VSRHYNNCQWCNDRSGGCLYCIDQLADSDQDKLQLIHDAIQRGEVHVLAVRNTQEVLLRPVGGKSRQAARIAQRAAPVICTHHLWAHDAGNLKRRYCTRPGCPARQAFRFLPDDPNRSGEWVDESRGGDTVQKHSMRTTRQPRLKTAIKK
jgi:hypothetical protein